jgi:hypothetical protein
MSKFNQNICLWMVDKEGKKLKFWAFSADKHPIESFYKRLIYPNRYKIPVAEIYENNILVKKYINGIEVPVEVKKWFGPDISSFKLKLIINDENNSQVGPFYSNSTITDLRSQYQALLYQYLNVEYPGIWISAIVMDIRNGEDKIIRKLKYDTKNKKVIQEL